MATLDEVLKCGLIYYGIPGNMDKTTVDEMVKGCSIPKTPLEKELAQKCQCECENSRDIPHQRPTTRPLSDEEIDRINYGGMDKIEKALKEMEQKDNWKHRSNGMRCRTCVFYVEKPSLIEQHPTGKLIGRCRRHAPTMNGFPVVFDGDWCGDHKLDEEKV